MPYGRLLGQSPDTLCTLLVSSDTHAEMEALFERPSFSGLSTTIHTVVFLPLGLHQGTRRNAIRLFKVLLVFYHLDSDKVDEFVVSEASPGKAHSF